MRSHFLSTKVILDSGENTGNDIMTVHEETIAKIRQLPESLVQEVNDFVEFLLMKHNRELLEIAESDFSDYLSNLEDYEEHLARGEIQW
ncbi:DUF2281 domain-containing protein [Aerosakkonema sp. BLCC-F2]